MRTLLVLLALATPAFADPDVVTNALEGPFATRAEACASIAHDVDCATLTIATKASAQTWNVEIGSITDHKAKDFALYVRLDKQWFAMALGTDGFVDMEMFPSCNGCQGEGCCAPSHMDRRSFYTVPALSFVAGQLVLFYATPNDVGFRETSPTAELVQVCRLVANVPECSEQVIALSPTKKRVKSPAALFTNGKLTQAP